jgi:hypothetical protein
MEHWSNDPDRGNPKYFKETPFEYHFFVYRD